MNGFSLLLTIASLGVVYSWRTGVDQHHRALVHGVLRQKGVVSRGHDVDNGVADAENVEAGSGHCELRVDAGLA